MIKQNRRKSKPPFQVAHDRRKCLFPRHICLLLVLLTFLSATEAQQADNPGTTTVDGVRFGTIRIQLQSRSQSTYNDLLFNVLSQTGKFLDDSLAEAYKEDNHASSGNSYDFSHVALEVGNFAMEPTEVGGQTVYDAKIDLDGTAMYTQHQGYEQSIIDQQVGAKVQSAFNDQTTYLSMLKTTDNALLNNLTFALVTIDLLMQEVQGVSGLEQSQRSMEVPIWAIGVMTAAICIIVLGATCIIYVCCFRNTNRLLPPPIVPKPTIQTNPSMTSSSKRTRTLDDDQSDKSRSPSPLRSITSQESSCFTYNPNSKGSKAGESANSFFGGSGSFQTNNSNVEIDVEAWQKSSTINTSQFIPFGNDISAIENKKDLSLIEEVDELMTPDHSTNQSRSMSSRGSTRSNLSEQRRSTLSELNLREMDRRRSCASAVIQDLNDLSAQIDGYRNKSMGGRHSLPANPYFPNNKNKNPPHVKYDAV